MARLRAEGAITLIIRRHLQRPPPRRQLVLWGQPRTASAGDCPTAHGKAGTSCLKQAAAHGRLPPAVPLATPRVRVSWGATFSRPLTSPSAGATAHAIYFYTPEPREIPATTRFTDPRRGSGQSPRRELQCKVQHAHCKPSSWDGHRSERHVPRIHTNEFRRSDVGDAADFAARGRLPLRCGFLFSENE